MPQAQEVVTREASQAVTVPDAATAFIQMVERAASNPAVDVDKLERLLAMQERIQHRRDEQDFNEAMAQAQAEMRAISTDAVNPQTRSRYASYAALDRVLRPIYTKHGFSLSFDTGDAQESMVRIVCYVARGGFTRTYKADMPADGKGAKGGDVMTKTHATGAAFTYGARYLLKLIFNVAVGEHETDGNIPGDTITEDQVKRLQSSIVEVGADLPKFLAYFKVEKLEELPAAKFDTAKKMLMQRASGKTKA